MAGVHDRLYKTEQMTDVDLGGYTHTLVRQIFGAMSKPNIKLQIDVDEKMTTNIETAVPIGLLLNEIITNVLKHAFPNDRAGDLSVSIKKDQEANFEIVIKDNGVGFTEGFDPQKSNSMGMFVIFTLVERQLRGEVEFDGSDGLTTTIRFQELNYKQRI